MSSGLSLNTIESLRLALLKIEHTAGPAHHEEALAHHRFRILNRLADLEAQLALIECLAPDLVDFAWVASPFNLTPPRSLAELQALQDRTDKVAPHELD